MLKTRRRDLCGATIFAFVIACAPAPPPTPIEQLYAQLEPRGLVYFHADFESLAHAPALKSLVEQTGGKALMTLQPELLAGVIGPTRAQLVVRTRSAYTGALVALGSGRVERLGDRLIRVELEHREPLPASQGGTPTRETINESAAVQIRFRPANLYALADLAPAGLNLNFIAKTLEGTQSASLTIRATDPLALVLMLTTGEAERTAAVHEALAKSLRFVESVTRATDPSNVWLPAIEGVAMQQDRTALRLTLPLSSEILGDLKERFSPPKPDR